MKSPKITIRAYDKVFKFDAKETCGYVKCDKAKKVYQISKDAIPLKTKKGMSFLCICGAYTHESIFYHTVFYNGKNITYGY